MTDKLATAAKMSPGLDAETMLSVIAGGDASKLTDDQRLAYYNARCEAAGLDPRTQPFEFIKLDNKLQLYARKAATDQLTAKHGISTEILSEATEGGLRIVKVRATKKDGTFAQNVGVVPVDNLKGNFLANAYMKAVTKALRRAILAVCGLGMLDESEIESIPAGKVERVPATTTNAPTSITPTPSAPPPDATQRAAEQIVEQAEKAQPPLAPRGPPPPADEDATLTAIRDAPSIKVLMGIMSKLGADRPKYADAFNKAAARLAGEKG